MGKIRCINANVFRSKYGDCSNNGISNRFSEILIPCKEGWIEVDSENLPENFCEVGYTTYGEKKYINLVPKSAGGKWTMFGGCFAWSSDSRFREYVSEQPVQIHDRIE